MLEYDSWSVKLLPLIFKLIKYCLMLKVDSEKMLKHITGHIEDYSKAIEDEQISKEMFINRLYLQYETHFTSEGM